MAEGRTKTGRIVLFLLIGFVLVTAVMLAEHVPSFNMETFGFTTSAVFDRYDSREQSTSCPKQWTTIAPNETVTVYDPNITLWGIPKTYIRGIFGNESRAKFLENYKNPCWTQNKTKSIGIWCLPYFYLLGVGKCGTTNIFLQLIKHPDIISPRRKELFYWTDVRKRKRFTSAFINLLPRKEIRKHHDGLNCHHKITLDASPGYFSNHGTLSTIPGNQVNGEVLYTLPHTLYSLNPGTKFLVTLRNPTERLFSHYHHFHSGGFSPRDFHEHVVIAVGMMEDCLASQTLRNCAFNSTLNTAIRQHNRIMLHYSMYYPYAKEWLSVFPREQILFIKAEDFYANTSKIMTAVFQFLNLDEFSSKTNQVTSNKNGTNTYEEYQPMLETTRQLLDKFFEPFNKKLAELLGDPKWLFQK